ncbi:MAG: MarR family transcriptional regulator, partial [Hyphomicrobiales bacterium]|nr:MarR family transcriptional regulator [Hyphomicrobiales bacterium]
ETKAHEHEDGHQAQLRLWLRLLSFSALVESQIRRRLREDFRTTLPRFDLMAQLERADDGMILNELSKRMMVTNGNVTGLVERLVAEGLVERRPAPKDRRSQFVRLTPLGRRLFQHMAGAHGRWLAVLFSGLDEKEMEEMMGLLGKAKLSAREALSRGELEIP